MSIALIGSTGFIGTRILAEARRRNHEVSVISREQADILDSAQMVNAIRAHNAVISAYGNHGEPELIIDATRSLLAAVKEAGVPRLLAVGGAGSLEVAPGVQLMDAPGFPGAYAREARAQGYALDIYRSEKEVDWTYVSPAAEIAAGERTGKFRVGGDMLLMDSNHLSRISAEDFAVAIIDELERGRYSRARFSVAY